MDRNRDLFWELLEPEHLKVRAFCRKLAGNREDGDDLCQESLVAAFTRFASLRDPARFRPWLYRIAVNHYRNSRRRAFWRRLVPAGPDHDREPAGADPSGALGARRLLERAFRHISTEDRALIVLFETEGWSIAELARMRGRSEASTKVRLFRIRARMRKALTRYLAKSERQQNETCAVRKDHLCIVTKPNVD